MARVAAVQAACDGHHRGDTVASLARFATTTTSAEVRVSAPGPGRAA